MSAVTEYFRDIAKSDPPFMDHEFGIDFLIDIASASDAELNAKVNVAICRLSESLGAVSAQLFRLVDDTMSELVYNWPPLQFGLECEEGLPLEPAKYDTLIAALRQSAPERLWDLSSFDVFKTPGVILGTWFGVEQDGGALVFCVPFPGTPKSEMETALLKPLFGGLLSVLRRTEKTKVKGFFDVSNAQAPDKILVQLSAAAEVLDDGVVIYDAENRLVACNRRFRELYVTMPHSLAGNRSQNPVPGHTASEYILPDGRFLKVIQSLMPSGERIEVHSDITQLRLAEQRLSNLIDGAGVCTWEWNVTTGDHRVNEYWAALLGYQMEELSPVTFDTWRERVHPDDLAATEALFEKAVSDDKVVYLAEYRLRHKHGHWVWVLDTGRTLRRGPDGSPELIAGVQVNISEQKAREAALTAIKAELERSITERAKVEQRLADIATVSDGWLWEMDSDRRYSLVLKGESFNDGDVPKEGLLGMTQEEWLDAHPDMRPGIDWDSLLTLLNSNQRFRDFIYRAPQSTDGTIQWLRMTGSPIFDDSGAFMGYRGVGSDVTELYEAKARAEEASHAKSMFVANMSHEIRTPLNGVLGMAEVLDGALSDPDHKRMIGTIRRSGESLLNILNDILDISKIEAGKLELERVPFRLQDVAEQVEELHALRAEDKGLELEVLIGAGSEMQFMGDPYRVLQILHNLVSNAIKFTEKGEVEVKIAGRDGSPLFIEVRDTGIGMTAAQLVRLHDEFSQADVSVTRRFGGTGLGMAITRTLVERMGGTIHVESTFGEGTTIQVFLPLPVSTKPAEDFPENGNEPISLAGVRILAADDNATNRAVLEAMLTRRGAEVVLVSDGDQAVKAWSFGAFDVVLLDIAMPVMDGPTALREIRVNERISGSRSAPIIAITANVMAHQIAEYLTMGFDLCLAKPLDSAQLAFGISSLLADRRQT